MTKDTEREQTLYQLEAVMRETTIYHWWRVSLALRGVIGEVLIALDRALIALGFWKKRGAR